jgi:hypothetical protein
MLISQLQPNTPYQRATGKVSAMSLAILLVAIIMGNAPAQAELAQTPTSEKRWINSRPIDLNLVKGKVIALLFFEEG